MSTTTVPVPNPVSDWILYNLYIFGNFAGFTTADPILIITRLGRALFGLLGLIFLILVIWSGFMIMISGGNEERVGQAKKTFVNAIIGLIIILASYSIVSYILTLLLPPATGLPQ